MQRCIKFKYSTLDCWLKFEFVKSFSTKCLSSVPYKSLLCPGRHTSVSSFCSDTRDSNGEESTNRSLPKRVQRKLRRLRREGIFQTHQVDVTHDSQTSNMSSENRNRLIGLRPEDGDGVRSVENILNNASTDAEDAEFPSDLRSTESLNQHRDQSRRAHRPNMDPDKLSIFLFPGQGSQFVGMGKKLLPFPGVKEMYEEASSILGYDLLKLCLYGPKEELDKTIHCQPAILVTSLAAVERMKDDNPKAVESCIAACGFSVGEFAALCFARSLSFEDAVEVIQVRAKAMQRASEEHASGMMTVFSNHETKLRFAMLAAREFCSMKLKMQKPVCSVANYLSPECKVVAGNIEALEFIEGNAADFGIRRTIRLPVSGAFHTDLMKDAKEPLMKALKQVNLQQPVVSVHSNLTSKRYKRNLKEMIKTLGKQVHEPVMWEQTMHVLYSRKQGVDFPNTYEVGPGKQLGTLLRLVNLQAAQKYKPVEV